MSTPKGELKASDIAKLHGIHRQTAYRWLVELEKKFGPTIVGRRGKKGVLFTTADALASVAPLARGIMHDLQTRVGALEEKQQDDHERIEVLEKNFRQLSLRWLDRGTVRKVS